MLTSGSERGEGEECSFWQPKMTCLLSPLRKIGISESSEGTCSFYQPAIRFVVLIQMDYLCATIWTTFFCLRCSHTLSKMCNWPAVQKSSNHQLCELDNFLLRSPLGRFSFFLPIRLWLWASPLSRPAIGFRVRHPRSFWGWGNVTLLSERASMWRRRTS